MQPPMKITVTFLGAAETVTGSSYLVELESGSGTVRILVDAGIFQGDRRWREENWRAPTFDPSGIDAVLVTHAHIDHTGMLPRLFRLGLRAPVFCTAATQAFSRVLLPDSGRLQEEEASFRARRHRSRHNPPLPLYTELEAQQVLTQFRSVEFGRAHQIAAGVSAIWRHTGHILGAASIELSIEGRSLVFSGDIGRYGVPILRDPEPVGESELLVIESTYGDRLHPRDDSATQLASIISHTAARGGMVLIPAFAVGRTQHLLYLIRELKEQRRIPDLPIIIDSPMARDATSIYASHQDDYDDLTASMVARGTQPFSTSKIYFVRAREESIRLNSIDEPMVVLSASGMLAGGRVLHHLRNRIGDPRNTVLFTGHQPAGGKGAWLLAGNKTIRIFNEEVPVRAEMREISGLSAHADRDELLRWCRSCTAAPRQIKVVHGEVDAVKAFSETLRRELGWNAEPARFGERVTL